MSEFIAWKEGSNLKPQSEVTFLINELFGMGFKWSVARNTIFEDCYDAVEIADKAIKKMIASAD